MGIFDQQAARMKLVIVHSENTVVFANYLQMLISSKDDVDNSIVGIEDGSVETTIWSDKEYNAQKPTLSSLDHILFIGRGKMIAEESYGMKNMFNKFGMKYGWLGKHAYLKVSGGTIKRDQLENFFSFASQYDPEITAKSVIEKEFPTRPKFDFGPIGFAYDMIYGGKINDRIRSCQYKTVTTVFYREGLAEFLKN